TRSVRARPPHTPTVFPYTTLFRSHDEDEGGDDHSEQSAHHLHPEALGLSAEKPHRRADERSDHDGGRQPEKAEDKSSAGADPALKEGVGTSAPCTLEEGEADRDRHRHRHQDVD